MNKPWTLRNAEYTAKALAELADSYTTAPICYRDMHIHLEDDHPDGKPGRYVICLGEWIRGNDWPELKAAIDNKLRVDRVCAGEPRSLVAVCDELTANGFGGGK